MTTALIIRSTIPDLEEMAKSASMMTLTCDGADPNRRWNRVARVYAPSCDDEGRAPASSSRNDVKKNRLSHIPEFILLSSFSSVVVPLAHVCRPPFFSRPLSPFLPPAPIFSTVAASPTRDERSFLLLRHLLIPPLPLLYLRNPRFLFFCWPRFSPFVNPQGIQETKIFSFPVSR